MDTKPLDIDPIAEGRRHWAERWGEERARPMAAITSIMRAQQILLGHRNRRPSGDVTRPAVTGTGDRRATLPVDVVHPLHLLRIGLDVRQLEVDHDGLLPASHDHARQRRLRARVDLLVWHVRRDEDESPGPASATNSSRSPQRMRALPLAT